MPEAIFSETIKASIEFRAAEVMSALRAAVFHEDHGWHDNAKVYRELAEDAATEALALARRGYVTL